MRSRVPWLTLALAALATAVHFVPGASESLQFDRRAVANGEAWRWLTGHVAHFGVNHLAWDVGTLLVLGWSCERLSRRRTAVAGTFAALAITPALWLWQPQFDTYRGLSGIDSALFGLLAATMVQHPRAAARLTGLVAFLAVAAKSGFEVMTQRTLFTAETDYAPVPFAHLVGVCAGALAALPRPAISRSAVSPASPQPCP